ncbi:ubiquitin carboxyl-terminal hydrolase RPN11-like [Selaginella moellendorffii]|uniref:ubiquitin carboxyl-terminal hydrolase RPN11-like n=1 Tax=Selaginella moellendorffii TaxID=88036 RepID=UPI000D1C7F7B|nr:ubiquitin carboxyl-terminal hydrolase RPN11-like [Selaginella moellendorffii]|eukprot:XP_024520378.1 ubiquitin carboxyl-terminal hydrolase RPN11-like [Selaginella moellendorffii]
MGLMLGDFMDEYTVRVIDVFAMPQSGTGVSVEVVDPVFQTKMMDMLKQTGSRWSKALLNFCHVIGHFHSTGETAGVVTINTLHATCIAAPSSPRWRLIVVFFRYVQVGRALAVMQAGEWTLGKVVSIPIGAARSFQSE